jgi:hypothetical protein
VQRAMKSASGNTDHGGRAGASAFAANRPRKKFLFLRFIKALER